MDGLDTLVAQGKVNQTQLRFYLGYAGWSENQLEGELLSQSWVATELSIPQIMLPDTTKLWKESLRKIGPPYADWAKYPSDPRMN